MTDEFVLWVVAYQSVDLGLAAIHGDESLLRCLEGESHVRLVRTQMVGSPALLAALLLV